MAFPIIAVPDDASTLLEQLGSKSKFWYPGPDGRMVLFKEGRPGTGENWAEKVACEVARLLGLPHADYELATWRNKRDVVSPSFVPNGGRLVHGNEVLAAFVADYDTGRRFRAKQHTVSRVMAIAKMVHAPQPWSDGGLNGAEVFVGYLLLDALLGNQDRHHENWGLVATAEHVTLAPTFDHASSLGRNETDAARVDRMTTRDKGRSLDAYVERAASAFFEVAGSQKPLTTLEAFARAATLAPAGAAFWLERLAQIRAEQYATIVADLPPSEASGPARDFALGMLRANAHRLLRHPLGIKR